MPMQQGCNIAEIVASRVSEFEDAIDEVNKGLINPTTILELERRLHRAARRLADAIMAAFLRWLLCETSLDRVAVRLFKAAQSRRYKDEGKRTVKVHFPGGSVYAFMVSYLRPKKKRKRGRPKNHGNRGKGGKGVFPVLELLGIHVVHSKMKVTPLFEDRVVYALTASDSHQAARKLLEKWGIELDAGRLQNFFEKAGKDFRDQRDEWLCDHPDKGPIDPDLLADERVVVSVDGARCRIRKNRPGRPAKSGYHRFDAEWKEPKLFCIYTIDDNGKRQKKVRSMIDGVLIVDDEEDIGADALFERLKAYLEALRIGRAEEVIFVADGAPWIWNRARPMLEELGVDGADICEVVDWYHAKETVFELSEMPTNWSAGKRAHWRKKTLDALYDGDTAQVVELIETLSEAPGATKAKSKCGYFSNNAERMNYKACDERNVPKGSGAVESAIRRVVNQRIKSNAKFWKPKNVETMLLWRGYLKTERLEDLLRWSRQFRARWWTDSDRQPAQNALKAA